MNSDFSKRRFASVDEMVANVECPTPLVRVRSLLKESGAELYLKLEWMNPFGSIKDRTAKFLLNGLKEKGCLEGKKIVEPTSGNTGIALVALANLMGCNCTITIPEGVPEEKQILLRLLGCDLMPTPDDLCPIDHPKDGAIALAHSIVNDPQTGREYVMPNQYENPDNVKAHYTTTGPEIWNQTDGMIRYFFAGYGTCGTITGTAKFLKERNPEIKVIGIMPQKGHKLPGLKNFLESKKPVILDESLVDETIIVPDEPAYEMTRRLIRNESLLAGPSTGAVVHAAIEYMKGKSGIAVAISPDNIFKYMSYLK